MEWTSVMATRKQPSVCAASHRYEYLPSGVKVDFRVGCVCLAKRGQQFCAIHARLEFADLWPVPLTVNEIACYPIHCEKCKGVGACKVCDGQGQHRCRDYQCDSWHECGACKGMGTCETCHGEGRITYVEQDAA